MDPEIRYLTVLAGGLLTLASVLVLHLVREADVAFDEKPGGARISLWTAVTLALFALAVGFVLAEISYHRALVSHENNERVLQRNAVAAPRPEPSPRSPWDQIRSKANGGPIMDARSPERRSPTDTGARRKLTARVGPSAHPPLALDLGGQPGER